MTLVKVCIKKILKGGEEDLMFMALAFEINLVQRLLKHSFF